MDGKKIMSEKEKQERINEEYITEEDQEAIRQWCDSNQTTISFRSAGPATLKCLRRGAGAKPHDILAKTIKYSSPDRKQQEPKENPKEDEKKDNIIDTFLGKFGRENMDDLLCGLVGHWTNDTIDGIYLTTYGANHINRNYIEKEPGKKFSYLKLDDNAKGIMQEILRAVGGFNLEEKKPVPEHEVWVYKFYRLFFSGDYDIHDLWELNKPVASERDIKYEEDGSRTGILVALQESLYEKRREALINSFGKAVNKSTGEETVSELIREETASDYWRVQHGAQYNYIAQMFNEDSQHEKEGSLTLQNINYIVEQVANMASPVAVFGKFIGSEAVTQSILEGGEVKNFYDAHRITLKETWTNDDAVKNYVKKAIKRALIIYLGEQVQKELTIESIEEGLLARVNTLSMYKKNYPQYVNEILEEMVREDKYFSSVKRNTKKEIVSVFVKKNFGKLSG